MRILPSFQTRDAAYITHQRAPLDALVKNRVSVVLAEKQPVITLSVHTYILGSGVMRHFCVMLVGAEMRVETWQIPVM